MPLFSPARGQYPVQHVVDGDGADQPSFLVAHWNANEVVGGDADREVPFGKVGPDESARRDAITDFSGGGLAQQELESDAAEIAAGRRPRGRLADVDLRGRGHPY